MLVKLLDRSDIIRHGKTVIDLPNHIAKNLINAQRAVEYVGKEYVVEKTIETPPKDKMIWNSPERKALENINEEELGYPFPGKLDPLFPEHIIGRK
jgi:hypothetical protein